MEIEFLKLRNIFLICFLIIILVTYMYITNKNNLNSSSYQQYYIEFKDFELNKKLEKYLNNGYEVTINKINGDYLYGDIHDTTNGEELFVTKNIFSYNYRTKEFEIYNFNYNYRILNYFILNDAIYASLIFKDPSDSIGYKWSIIKYSKDFKNVSILESGKILEPVNAPNFYYNDVNNTLYSITITEDIIQNNDEITERLQKLTLYQIDNNNIISLKTQTGDYINKTGLMLCSIFNVQIYNDSLLFCLTDYQKVQYIKSINLEDLQEEILFTNNLDNNWIINNFEQNNNNLYIGMFDIKDNQIGKTVYYNLSTDDSVETSSDVFYGLNSFVNDKMLFHNLEKWKIYVTSDNRFYPVSIIGKYKNNYLYPAFYIINNNILVRGNDNIFYIGKLEEKK